ncbi:50S ribosomal protein L31e [uncultured archaeon]|nr:50S ribosomal protein L31e [uncultured archaeon]
MAQEFKEKTITVNLRAVFAKPTTKRAINAKHVLKNAVRKETRLKELKISNKVNELIWSRGRFNAPRKMTIKVIAEKENGIIMLPEEKYEAKKDKKDQKGKAPAKEEAKKTEEKAETKKTEEKKETKTVKEKAPAKAAEEKK